MKKSLISLLAIALFIPVIGHSTCVPDYQKAIVTLQDELDLGVDDTIGRGVGYWLTSSTSGPQGAAVSTTLDASAATTNAELLRSYVKALKAITQAEAGSGTTLREVTSDISDVVGKNQTESQVANQILELNEMRVFCMGTSLATYSEIVKVVATQL